MEAQFYLLLPLVAALFVRMPLRAFAAAVAIALAWQWDTVHDMRPLVDALLALGSHWQWPESQVRDVLAIQLPAFAAHFALGIVMARAWLRWREPDAKPAPAAARVAAALLALAFLGAGLQGARGPLAFAGRVSYSAYLYHFPLLLLWNVYARAVPGAVALPAYLALLLAIAWASWRYVEQPFLRLTFASASPLPAP